MCFLTEQVEVGGLTPLLSADKVYSDCQSPRQAEQVRGGGGKKQIRKFNLGQRKEGVDLLYKVPLRWFFLFFFEDATHTHVQTLSKNLL